MQYLTEATYKENEACSSSQIDTNSRENDTDLRWIDRYQKESYRFNTVSELARLINIMGNDTAVLRGELQQS